jgi:glycosyltransferase involved in cell wall biosynthesis
VARIHLIIAGHLAMSPRGRREATVLQGAGHDVTVSGIWFDSRLAAIDRVLMRREDVRFSPALDLRAETGFTRHLAARAQARGARELFRATGIFHPELLGYGVRRQWLEARRLDADLTIVHGEAGLWIARELLREGRRVGVDFEDWFSRDLPPEEHRARPVGLLTELEATILRHANYRVASSHTLADALAATYGVPAPAIVTNAGQERAPDSPPTAPPDNAGPLRLHWFSQTIGPARGLELLFAALPLVRHPVQITLRGACSTANRAWLDRIIPPPCRSAVMIAPPVPPWRLAECVARDQVGLALETSAIPSRDVCISNKFFQYLAAGLAVIATPTQGQREAMARCPEAGRLLAEASPRAFADAIDFYTANRRKLAAAREAARAAAKDAWSGMVDRNTILHEAEAALRPWRSAQGVSKKWLPVQPAA